MLSNAFVAGPLGLVPAQLHILFSACALVLPLPCFRRCDLWKTNVSQGSVATCLRCDEIFNDRFISKFCRMCQLTDSENRLILQTNKYKDKNLSGCFWLTAQSWKSRVSQGTVLGSRILFMNLLLFHLVTSSMSGMFSAFIDYVIAFCRVTASSLEPTVS